MPALLKEATRRKAWSKKTALANEPTWSGYQTAVFDWVAIGKGNLQVGAVAGSGKTTLIEAIIPRLPSDAKIQVLAFNKHIVDTLKGKLPTRVGITTAHSMGNSLIAREFAGVPTVDAGKYRKIARSFIAPLDPAPYACIELDKYECHVVVNQKAAIAIVRRNWMKFALDLIRGCQSTLCSPDTESLKELISYYGIKCPIGGELIVPLIEQILERGESIARDKQIVDFGDMLWIPYRWNLQPTAKDWVLIDEVQDANLAQLHLYEKCGRNGRVIVVGDEDQAIQGFAFASPKMWGTIATRFNAHKLPLSVCYRCPTEHLDLARYFVPAIEPAPNAKEGDISVIHPDMVGSLVEEGNLVLCRFTAPLIDTCLDLIRRGIPAKVRGREIGVNLARLADIGESNWPDFANTIAGIMELEISKFRDADEDDQADSVKDDLGCILSLHRSFGGECSSLAQFIEKIESVFSDSDSPVILSTIHRSKGDEAKRVFILKSNSLPYRRDEMLEWQAKQEDNLAYVALTRAKESLIFVPIGRDEEETQALLSHPYGGFDVSPIPFDPDAIVEVVPTIEAVAIEPHESAIGAYKVGRQTQTYKVGDRIQYIGKKDQRYGSESIRGKILTVATVHNGYLSANTPPMGCSTDGYRTTWIDFKDVTSIEIKLLA